jgi:hypothetical protein
LELRMLQDMEVYIVFLLIAGSAIIGLSIYRSVFLKGISSIQFDEESEKAVTVLAIEG